VLAEQSASNSSTSADAPGVSMVSALWLGSILRARAYRSPFKNPKLIWTRFWTHRHLTTHILRADFYQPRRPTGRAVHSWPGTPGAKVVRHRRASGPAGTEQSNGLSQTPSERQSGRVRWRSPQQHKLLGIPLLPHLRTRRTAEPAWPTLVATCCQRVIRPGP
jgi:hypothetical protein